MRDVKFSLIYQHEETWRFNEQIRSLDWLIEYWYPQDMERYSLIAIREYTWLNDKLWNPIYDLDILRKPTGTIDWKQNYRYEIVKEHNITVNDWGIIIGWFEFNDDIDDYELWGNIYENKYPWTFNFESPELLNN